MCEPSQDNWRDVEKVLVAHVTSREAVDAAIARLKQIKDDGEVKLDVLARRDDEDAELLARAAQVLQRRQPELASVIQAQAQRARADARMHRYVFRGTGLLSTSPRFCTHVLILHAWQEATGTEPGYTTHEPDALSRRITGPAVDFFLAARRAVTGQDVKRSYAKAVMHKFRRLNLRARLEGAADMRIDEAAISILPARDD